MEEQAAGREASVPSATGQATGSVASAALGACGGDGPIRRLATGMSSVAWVGSIGDVEHVIRVPVGDGRRPLPAYDREARLLEAVGDRLPVAVPTVVRVGDRQSSVAPLLPGRPVRPNDWTASLAREVADVFGALHALPPSLAVEPDVFRRFHLATIWPFDDSSLFDHPVGRIWPERVAAIERLRPAIERAAAGPTTVVHTDLHPAHVLIGGDGSLAGILDFGDSFAGVAAWDHACLRYYHGAEVQRRVAAAMGSRAPNETDVELVGIAWGLYRLAKTPDRDDVRGRVEQLLNTGFARDIP